MAASRTIDRWLRRSPVQWGFEARRTDKLAVITMHAVADRERFEQQLDVLASVGRFVSLSDVVAAVEHGAALPPRPILLTFDDGDRTLYDVAAPALLARDVPAVAFVVTSVIGTSTPLWWYEVEHLVPQDRGRVAALKRMPDAQRRAALDELRSGGPAVTQPQLAPEELRTMAAQGIAIGSHTATHPMLDQCSRAEIDREVSESFGALHSLLGEPPTAFAYPNGATKAEARAAVADAGFRVAFLFDHRLSPVPPPDPFAISRLRLAAAANDDRVRTIVSGLHPALLRARGRT